MALTRKMLSAMGIDEDKQDEIINAHIEVVNALKEERDNFKADAKKAEKLQKEVDDLNESMKSGERSPYKVKYEAKVEEYNDLKKQFDDYKADVSAKEVEAKKSSAYKELLKSAGVSEKRIDSIIKITDLSKVEIDDDGKIKDSDSLTKNIKDEWSDFIVTQSEQGAQTANPPQNTGGTKMTRAEIYKKDDHGRYVLSTAERQKALIENSQIN